MMHFRLCHNEVDALEDGLFFTLQCKTRLRARLLYLALCLLSVNSRDGKRMMKTNNKGE